MADRQLIYFADPMCSWCWGFAPVIDAIQERWGEALPIRLVMGGLRPGTTEPMAATAKSELAEHWTHVTEASGQPFTDQGMSDPSFVYDTDPAARATVVVRRAGMNLGLRFLHDAQRAFYADGRDVTQIETLADIAARLGMDRAVFVADLADEKAKQETWSDYAISRGAEVTGFPTLIAGPRPDGSLWHGDARFSAGLLRHAASRGMDGGGVTDAPPLGIIEGYYGRPWSAADRLATIADLAPVGFSFFIHAPKADPFLRRRWKEDHPEAARRAIAELASACARMSVRFGVGLSPYEIYLGFDEAAKSALARKLAWLDEIGVTDLAILFDDMRGDLPDLAARQAAILHWVFERTAATRLIVCPTYYSDDPVLDRVFGTRPAGYLKQLGAALDPKIDVFWTGAEVCSREFSAANLSKVATALKRPPVLWDNYPVNDGPIMSRYLHLRRSP